MSTKLRRNRIREIVKTQNVNKQEELANILLKEGFSVTQATVSRDIKELGIVKVKSNNKYKYTLIEKQTENTNSFSGVVLDVITAQNLIVVKTSVGSASSVCIFIDNAQIKGIVGTVAGDDTIIIVTLSNEDAIFVTQELKRILK